MGGLSPTQAKMLLEGNALNLAKKVTAGTPLNPKEVAMLEAITASEEIAGQPQEKKWVKTKVELAEELGVTRQTIDRWNKQKGFPKPKSNGRYDVAAVREWAAKHGHELEEDDLDQTRLKAQQILLQNQTLEFKLSVMRKEYVAKEDVERWTSEMILQAKKVLLQGPAGLAPQVVGVSVPEAETILKQWLAQALGMLSDKPLGGDGDE